MTRQTAVQRSARVLTGDSPGGIRTVLGGHPARPRKLFKEVPSDDEVPSDVNTIVSLAVDRLLKNVRVRAAAQRARRYGVALVIVLVLVLVVAIAGLGLTRSMAFNAPVPHTCVFRVQFRSMALKPLQSHIRFLDHGHHQRSRGVSGLCLAVAPAGPDAECAWRPTWKKPLQCEPLLLL